MRMYCAKQRALVPVVIALLATEQLGKETFVRPAFVASTLISAGVMSGEPVICSAFKFELTVERPLAPSAITATPKAMRIAPEMNPPISSTFFMTVLLEARS